MQVLLTSIFQYINRISNKSFTVKFKGFKKIKIVWKFNSGNSFFNEKCNLNPFLWQCNNKTFTFVCFFLSSLFTFNKSWEDNVNNLTQFSTTCFVNLDLISKMIILIFFDYFCNKCKILRQLKQLRKLVLA